MYFCRNHNNFNCISLLLLLCCKLNVACSASLLLVLLYTGFIYTHLPVSSWPVVAAGDTYQSQSTAVWSAIRLSCSHYWAGLIPCTHVGELQSWMLGTKCTLCKAWKYSLDCYCGCACIWLSKMIKKVQLK